jgi:hypothetical protein
VFAAALLAAMTLQTAVRVVLNVAATCEVAAPSVLTSDVSAVLKECDASALGAPPLLTVQTQASDGVYVATINF